LSSCCNRRGDLPAFIAQLEAGDIPQVAHGIPRFQGKKRSKRADDCLHGR
jgi:hypothetical protein